MIISEEEAISLIREKLSGVISPQTTVDVDHVEGEDYIVHVYDVVRETETEGGHTATVGWYNVNKLNGNITITR
ncbi:hypothetical protein [Paenibacillus amylolyticus]|uniref:hypothetical protein n=1 Tax=Paenibacillus amylolyticus TaxID=1451 RepID=UPI000B82DB4A|nr:hypothetical protein [Paenibacillus amylolyticus]